MTKDYDLVAEMLSKNNTGDVCSVYGRVSAVRRHKNVLFLDIYDHTGKLQVVADKTSYGERFEDIRQINPGSYIRVGGNLSRNRRGDPEIQSYEIENIAPATLPVNPTPWGIDGTDPTYGNQVFDYPGLYLANPQRGAVLRVMSNFIGALHEYFQDKNFTQVQPPILTDKTLYTQDNAIRAKVHGEDIFLSQCATFELEPLAMAFGKVYTISPAFRNEEGGSKRHLAEYTHAKAEVLMANVDDLMFLAGDSLYHALRKTADRSERELKLLGVDLDVELIHPSRHERIRYDDALKITQAKGSTTPYGHGLTRTDEQILTKHFGDRYVWMQFPPFCTEGFPYRRKPDERHLSMTCDLIAPHGAGEMVGVAEKIFDAEELIVNIMDKGKNPRDYWEYILLRKYGMPPHGGIGAAPERIMYGLLNLDHVRLTKPWPRYPDRNIKPDLELNPWNDEELARLIEKYKI